MNDDRSSPEGARWKVPDLSPEDQHRDQSYLDEMHDLRQQLEALKNAAPAVSCPDDYDQIKYTLGEQHAEL